MTITPLTESRFDDFVRLIHALADYEHLDRPDAAAMERLRADAFGPRRRFEAALAVDDTGRAVGYAIWFETYSSFLAKPTIYLEDLFVLERRAGPVREGCSSSTCARWERSAGADAWTGRSWTGTPRRATSINGVAPTG